MPTKKPAAKSSAKAPAKKAGASKAAPAKKPVAKNASAKPAAKVLSKTMPAKSASKAVHKTPPKHVAKVPAKTGKSAPVVVKPVVVKPTKSAGKPVIAKPTAKTVVNKPAVKESAKATEAKVDKAPGKAAATAAASATPKRPEVKMPPQSNVQSSGHPPAPPKVVAVAESRKRPLPVAADNDDSDGVDPNTNLLAGPRNVTPYQPKRGEQYMNKVQLDHFRQILSTWKHDLMEEVDRTVHHMKDEAANFPDPNDRATQESEFSLELRTRDRERKLIRKIDEAIVRIDDGSYGYCVETGEEIGIKRLEARPVATLSVEAQERRERREKQYGDRDDRYR